LDEDEKRERLGVFEKVHKLFLAIRGQMNTDRICGVVKSEMSEYVKCDLILFLRYSREALSVEVLASSESNPGVAIHSSIDEPSSEWIERQRGCKLSWFPSLESAPNFLREIGNNWNMRAAAIYTGDDTDSIWDMLIIGRNEAQDERWIGPSQELMDLLRGASLILSNIHLISEVGIIKSDIKAIFDLAPVGILIIDSDGTVIDVNNHALSILGGEVPLESMVGESILTSGHLKGSGLDLLIQKTIEGQETENDNFKLKAEGGRVSYLHIKLRPVPKANGMMMAICVMTDVTQRVRLQQQLERSYRTLTEAFQELQKVDKMKTKFIDVVSHELRTPLTVMRGYLEFLESEYGSKLDPKVLSKMQIMKVNADRMYDLVESMLDAAQIERGAMVVSKHEVSVKALVEEVVASQRQFATEKHQELTVVAIGDIGLYKIDAKKMRDALKNITNNAIRYTPEGGRIQVGIADEGKMLHIWIKDNGVGIPTSDLEKIFDRFHIVTAEELSHQVDRIGLGLPITKGIIEGHGGKIWVESEVGKGSIFHINIPKD